MVNRFRHGPNTVLTTLFVASVICAEVAAGDWLGFRGPTRFGASDDAQVPLEWSDTKNLNWKVKLPGAGFSSPIVVDGRVFATCFTGVGGDLKRHLVCVDLQSGSINWTESVSSDAEEVTLRSFATNHGYASSTPVSDGERVYAFFGNAGVAAYDLDGNMLWKSSVGAENASMFGSGTSPVIYKHLLIVPAGAESESIRAFDKTSGEEAWKAEGRSLSRSYATPVIAKNTKGEDELLISVPGEVWSLNPETGKLRWYASTPVDLNACPSCVVENNVAYIIGGRGGGRMAVRLGGKGDVTDSHVVWSLRGGSYVPSPVFYEGRLYWINDNGIATCVDAKTGEEIEKTRVGGKFYASLVLIRDNLYAVSRFSGTHVLKATPSFDRIALNKLSDESDFSASPAVSDGRLILRSNEYLYCIQTD